ncbi:MAG: glycosyltransferase family 4 protein [bacterium]|nr:glycosyltransferase family 4 protein [bacterium]
MTRFYRHRELLRSLAARCGLPSPAFPVRKLKYHDGRYRNQVAGRRHQRGANLIGFAFGEFGIGEHLRFTARSFAAAGVPFSVCNYGKTLHRQEDSSLGDLIDPTHPCHANVFCLNNDCVLDLYDSRRALFKRRYNIGYGFWELRDYPPSWLYAMNVLDEIWAPSRHIQHNLADRSSVPVVHMPMAVDFTVPRRYARRDFAIPEDCFVFLSAFDFSSRIQRKNPMATVAAFRQAFAPERRDVMLVFKTKTVAAVDEQRRDAEELAAVLGEDPRIRLINETFSREQILDLIGCCDAYVSLHRAEGFGLPLAEAMKMGKPVIATNYSGNTDFMTPDNSCLVDYTLVEAKRGESYNFEKSSVWADADTAQAAHCMARLVADRDWAARLGAAAQHDIDTRHNFQVIGERYRQRLQLIGLL